MDSDPGHLDRPAPGDAWLRWLQREPVGALRDFSRRFPGIGTFRLGASTCHVVSDPAIADAILSAAPGTFGRGPMVLASRDFLGDGLLGLPDGEEHRDARRVVAATLRPRLVADESEAIVEQVRRIRDGWRDGQPLNAVTEMWFISLSMIIRILMRVDADDRMVRSVLDALDACLAIFDRETRSDTVREGSRFRQGVATLDAFAARAIDEARAGRSARGLAVRLLEAADQGVMTERSVRDHLVTLLQAGNEPLGVALAWTWYFLTENPDAEAAFHREVDAVLGDRLPTAADLHELPLTRGILAESMRLLTPVWTIERRATGDVTIGGHRFGAGDLVFINTFAIYHDAALFPDPERFHPERWPGGPLPRGANLAFGSGPRGCVGEGLAWVEGTLILATIGQRWRLRTAQGFEPRFQPRFTLRPGGGVPVTVHARS